MAERLHTNEQSSSEKNELKEAAQAQNERLRQDRERAADLLKDNKETNAEKARDDIDKAIETKDQKRLKIRLYRLNVSLSVKFVTRKH